MIEASASEGVRYPHVEVQLTGKDGNGFMIIARIAKALKRAGVPESEVQTFRDEAMAGDYDHLLQTALKTVICV